MKLDPVIKLNEELEQTIGDLTALGMDYYDMRQYDKAEKLYLNAWDLLPDPKMNIHHYTYHIYINLSSLLIRNEKYKKANDLLLSWILFSKKHEYGPKVKAYIICAKSYLHLRNVENAKTYLYEALKYDQKNFYFKSEPSLYLDIASKKITNTEKIQQLFDQQIEKEKNRIIEFTFKIKEIKSLNCKKRIEKALSNLTEKSKVSVNIEEKTITGEFPSYLCPLSPIKSMREALDKAKLQYTIY